MSEPKAVEKVHSPHCEGHIDCPKCGPGQCAKVVVWGPGGEADTVLCLGCYEAHGVHEAPAHK